MPESRENDWSRDFFLNHASGSVRLVMSAIGGAVVAGTFAPTAVSITAGFIAGVLAGHMRNRELAHRSYAE